jgi:hypothetical protein
LSYTTRCALDLEDVSERLSNASSGGLGLAVGT